MVDENGLVTPVWANFFEAMYRYEKAIAAAVDDGTYTVGVEVGNADGTITITTGIITAIQECA